jgi:hypothetical protein
MMKYTIEQLISYVKRNPINRVKEGFTVSILVFVSQLHQQF